MLEALLNSCVVPSIMQVVKKELLRLIARYRTNLTEVTLALEMLTLAAQREFEFV